MDSRQKGGDDWMRQVSRFSVAMQIRLLQYARMDDGCTNCICQGRWRQARPAGRRGANVDMRRGGELEAVI